ncbi:MAG: glycosyltransferase family 2 protein [Anaerolineae bacterium]|nr:glycosyltransferase family 2 protein [Anaerolineae bacterium]
MVDVSILVVNWNTRDLLARCLRAIQDTVKQVAYEVIVVDNHSNDGSQEMVKRDFPQVRLIENQENVGFARANNQAMEAAHGRYMLLLNSDAFLGEGALDVMTAFMDSHPDAGMASCKLVYEDGSLQRSCATFPTLMTEFYIALGLDKLFPHSKTFGRYLMTDWNYDDTRPVEVIMGAFMLVRATAIEEVGMMDEGFFMYSEEVDWCYRFEDAGWKVYFHPDVQAIHIWGGSSRAVKVETLIRLYRSRVQFFRKHYGHSDAWLYKGILIFNALVRVVPGALYYLTRGTPEARQKHAAFVQLLRAIPGF